MITSLLFILLNISFTACDKDNEYQLEGPIEIEVIEKRDTIIYHEGDTIRYDENGDTLRYETKLDTIKYANKKQIVTDFDELSYDNIIVEKAFYIEKHDNNSRQGLAIYEDYLLQTYHSKACVDVYDLTNNQFVFSIKQKAEGSVHCNNVDFGRLYEPTDPFPLLYLEYRGTSHTTGVYRIVNKTGSFELEKIQTISFADCKSAVTNNNMDTNEMYITYIDENHPADSQSIARIDIPDYLSGNQKISLQSPLIKEKINIQRKVHQDGTVYKNKLFQLRGGSGDGDIWIYDFKTHKTLLTIEWNKVGMDGEPEGIGWYKDHLVITNLGGQVYNIYFVK